MAGINESKAKLVEYMAEFGREIVSKNGKHWVARLERRGQTMYMTVTAHRDGSMADYHIDRIEYDSEKNASEEDTILIRLAKRVEESIATKGVRNRLCDQFRESGMVIMHYYRWAVIATRQQVIDFCEEARYCCEGCELERIYSVLGDAYADKVICRDYFGHPDRANDFRQYVTWEQFQAA